MTGTATMSSAAGLLRDFVNTAEPQVNGEELRSPDRLRDWFAGRAPIPAEARFDWDDLQVAVAVREGLRAVLMGHAGGDVGPQAFESLNAALAVAPVTPVFTAEGYRLTAVEDRALAYALAAVVDAIRQSGEDHSWQRLKVCARGTCQWAFFDESRNQSRRWCSMAGCGNHVKMRRAYAARKSQGDAS